MKASLVPCTMLRIYCFTHPLSYYIPAVEFLLGRLRPYIYGISFRKHRQLLQHRLRVVLLIQIVGALVGILELANILIRELVCFRKHNDFCVI